MVRRRFDRHLRDNVEAFDPAAYQLTANLGVTYPSLVNGTIPADQLPGGYLSQPIIYDADGSVYPPQSAWQFSPYFSLSTETLEGDRLYIDLASPPLPPQRGIQFSRLDAARIQLEAGAVIHCHDGSGGYEAVTIGSAITWNITTDLDTGSEASDTGYYLWLSNDGGSPSLVGSTSYSAPAGVTKYSRTWIWFAPNNSSSDLYDFYQCSNFFVYADDYGVFVLGSNNGTGGLATTLTAVDASGIVPEMPGGCWVRMFITAMNNSSAKNLIVQAGDKPIFDEDISSAAANSAYRTHVKTAVECFDPSELLKYVWNGTPAAAGSERGLNAAVQEFEIPQLAGATV